MKTVDRSKVIDTVLGMPSSGLGLSFTNGVSDKISYAEMEFLYRSIGRLTYRKCSAWIGAGTSVRADGSSALGVQRVC